LEDLNLN